MFIFLKEVFEEIVPGQGVVLGDLFEVRWFWEGVCEEERGLEETDSEVVDVLFEWRFGGGLDGF